MVVGVSVGDGGEGYSSAEDRAPDEIQVGAERSARRDWTAAAAALNHVSWEQQQPQSRAATTQQAAAAALLQRHPHCRRSSKRKNLERSVPPVPMVFPSRYTSRSDCSRSLVLTLGQGGGAAGRAGQGRQGRKGRFSGDGRWRAGGAPWRDAGAGRAARSTASTTQRGRPPRHNTPPLCLSPRRPQAAPLTPGRPQRRAWA